MNTEIVVALIALVGVVAAGVPAALIERARKENAADHDYVATVLERLDDHLDEIESSVDDVAEELRKHVTEPGAHG
jgi:hypothetical protein